MIEVELIKGPNENEAWLNQCLEGLNSPFVNIHLGESVPGHLNAARVAVWDKCGGDLLSSVDPDDIPIASIWEKLHKALDDNPDVGGAYSLECRINTAGGVIGVQSSTAGQDPSKSPTVAHHVLVVRRRIYELVRPFIITYPSGAEWILAMTAFKRGGLICVPEVGYKWRRHFTNGGRNFTHPVNLPKRLDEWLANK